MFIYDILDEDDEHYELLVVCEHCGHQERRKVKKTQQYKEKEPILFMECYACGWVYGDDIYRERYLE